MQPHTRLVTHKIGCNLPDVWGYLSVTDLFLALLKQKPIKVGVGWTTKEWVSSLYLYNYWRKLTYLIFPAIFDSWQQIHIESWISITCSINPTWCGKYAPTTYNTDFRHRLRKTNHCKIVHDMILCIYNIKHNIHHSIYTYESIQIHMYMYTIRAPTDI